MAARDESLALVYADALLALAFEKGVHGEILAELREIDALFDRVENFEAFLATPMIRIEDKKAVIDKVFGQLSEITLNFLRVVLDKKRQLALRSMIAAFIQGYHDRMGELVVSVKSAVPLASAQRDRLTKSLKTKYSKEIVLREAVDAALIGGLVLRVGDSRIDGSLRSRLESIGARLEAVRLSSEDLYED
ncbi:ATP synthase F1 subunit delta [Planctomycetota bacterium]|nr:ATP synthase F1 subunit delta [Planctomycetota bacterium]